LGILISIEVALVDLSSFYMQAGFNPK
jgi:hypothetical protein